MKFMNIFVLIFGTLVVCWTLSLFAALHAQDMDEPMREALKEQQAVQEEVQTWSEEKRALVQEILSLQTEKKWLQLQNEQHAAYIQQKEEAIARLKEQEEVAKSLRMELEPYLAEVVQRLQEKVTDDLPFLPQEREDRLKFMEQSLTEYGVTLSERLRRVLEALSVEAGYGSRIEVTDRELDGQKTKIRAQVVRIGRVGLFYVAQDGNTAGMWDEQSQGWKSLSQETARELQKAVDIVQERRVAELVTLPLGKPEEFNKQ